MFKIYQNSPSVVTGATQLEAHAVQGEWAIPIPPVLGIVYGTWTLQHAWS